MNDPIEILEKVPRPLRAEDVVDVLPDAVVVVDMNNAGKIVLANKQASFLFGYGSSELIGKSVDDFVPVRLRQAHKQHRGTFIDEPKMRSMGEKLELFCVNKDGREIPVEIMLAPMSAPSGNYVVAVIRRKKKDVE